MTNYLYGRKEQKKNLEVPIGSVQLIQNLVLSIALGFATKAILMTILEVDLLLVFVILGQTLPRATVTYVNLQSA